MTRFLPGSSEKETHPQNTPGEEGRKWLKVHTRKQRHYNANTGSPATGEVDSRWAVTRGGPVALPASGP